MKLICIEGTGYASFTGGLTIGKIYEGKQSGLVIDEVKFYEVEINNDNETNMIYNRKYIIPLEEWRNKQINAILI